MRTFIALVAMYVIGYCDGKNHAEFESWRREYNRALLVRRSRCHT